MKVRVLSSGSRGNTTYIECCGKKIIIDVGNSNKYVTEKLGDMGINPKEIDAILITHTHSDHIKGLKVFSKKNNIHTFITNGMKDELSYLEKYSIIHESRFYIGDVLIEVIKTSHDAPDSVGYIISGEGKSLAYVTDTGYINNRYFDILKNRDMYIMESNHDIEMLTNGKYPFKLRKRILSDKGHLSNYDSAKYLAEFVGNKTKYIVLAHLSDDNNTPDLAYNTLIDRFNNDNISLPKIIIAMQEEETEVISV